MLFKNQLEQIQDVASCLVVVKTVILDQYFRLSFRFDAHTLNKLTFCILLITQYIVYVLTCTTRYFSISGAELIKGRIYPRPSEDGVYLKSFVLIACTRRVTLHNLLASHKRV